LNLQKRIIVSILSLFVLGLVAVVHLTSSVVALVEDRFLSERKSDLTSQLLLAKSNLESKLFRDAFLVDSLATVFNINPQNAVESFSEIANTLLEKAKHVRNIGLGPNDVLSDIIPLENNEQAIGLDFRTVPDQYATVQAARERQDIYLTGPVNLVQGGRALIARIPVFNDYPVNSDYWGTVSVVINYEGLLESAGLLGISNIQVAIRGTNGTGESGPIFEGDEALFNDADYTGKLIIPNGEWWVAARFAPTLGSSETLFLELIRWTIFFVYTLLFGLIAVLWAYYIVERQRANADALTHLVNRRFTLDYLRRRYAGKNANDPFFVLAIDLNYFKEINDTLGHHAGDEVLKYAAQRMQAAVRGTDLVARMGGDEFLIILNRIKSPENVEKIITKIRHSVESQETVVDGIQVELSISIGAACSTESSTTVEDLLKLADTRMYADKAKTKAKHQNA